VNTICPACPDGPASEMTYIVSGGALNSTHSFTLVTYSPTLHVASLKPLW